MKELRQEESVYRLPSNLNRFQEQLYIHLIDWKRRHITEASGTSHGNTYDAILPEEVSKQRPLIYHSIRERLESHLQRFPFRFHKYFDHMASSQAANINLFLPILQHSQASMILARLKPDFSSLATDYLDNGFRIEFWDEPPGSSTDKAASKGSLGDKSKVSGTDSDIAIAYHNQDGVLCLWLIEHKLTESEFTTCGGHKSKGRQPHHDCTNSFAQLINDPSPCYYHEAKAFNYWKITAANRDFFPNIEQNDCPFRGGMNQLWRNQLLGLAIEHDKQQPYRHVTFSVVHHPKNDSLTSTIEAYQSMVDHNPKFTTFTSADVINACTGVDGDLHQWVNWYKDLYAVS